jgi:hypothetical protein
LDLPGAGTKPRHQMALKRCAEQIGWYERHAGRARLLYRTFQSAVVVLAGLTPVLALWEKASELAQVLPAALASVFAAIVGLWSWQENWVRFAATAEALKSELVKFQTRTGEAYGASLDEETVLNNFVVRIEGLASGELAAWGARQSQGDSPQDGTG